MVDLSIATLNYQRVYSVQMVGPKDDWFSRWVQTEIAHPMPGPETCWLVDVVSMFLAIFIYHHLSICILNHWIPRKYNKYILKYMYMPYMIIYAMLWIIWIVGYTDTLNHSHGFLQTNCDRPVRGKIHRDDARDEEQRFPGGTGRHRGRPTEVTYCSYGRLPTESMVLDGAGIYANMTGVFVDGILMVDVTIYIYIAYMDPIEDFPGFSRIFPQKTWKRCT